MNYKTALIGLALCACTSLRATPQTLGSGETKNFGLPSTLGTGTVVASQNDGFSGGTLLLGNVGVSVMTGVSDGYAGGLTFVYDVSNILDVNNDEGLISFSLGIGASYQTSFDLGDASGNRVQPGSAIRSADGSEITFTFPFVFDQGEAPPIFSGQTSYQLFLYTDATSWDLTSATFQSAYDQFDGGLNSYSTSTLGTGSSSVPDDSATALLAVMGIALVGVSARFRKRAKA